MRMSFGLSTVFVAALATAPPTVSPPSKPATWSRRQPWPVIVDGGVQALGFKPFPSNFTGSVGTELRWIHRRWYALHTGLAVGLYKQVQFERAGYLDASLGQRFTAPFGLYADFDVLVGGQLASVSALSYRAGEDGRLRAARAPVRASARVGLGLGLGFDFARVTRTPIRVFARYRQLVRAPFMVANGVPAMGAATLTGGVAVEIGSWINR